MASRKNIVLTLTYTLSKNVSVATDVKKVETILYNFISNAIKFSNQNGYIEIKIFIQNNDLQIEVRDTGRGIQAADLPYIFDRFYQSKTNGTSEGGSGLGLALSRELAQLLRGEIWATSEWGKGSSFFLRLPNVLAAQQAPLSDTFIEYQSVESLSEEPDNAMLRPMSEAANTPDSHTTASTYAILLVEDNADLQDYISEILQSNYRVIVKDNGKTALEYLENCEHPTDLPDLIISDVMMPIMDGYQLLNLLKGRFKYQKIPVIMLTARAGLEDKLKALRIGVDDYLTKPFIEAELFTRIANLLKNANLRKQANEGEASADDLLADMMPKWLINVEKLIYENMAQPDFSIEALSEKLGMSRQKFSRDIKKDVGTTAVQYIQEVRLQYARKMLENGEVQSIKAVSERVGITDVKYFSRLFKACFGRLPSEYLS